MPRIICGMAAALLAAGEGQAANVYVLSSGDPATDQAVVSALTAGGHTATVGVQFTQFDGSQILTGFDAVYFQANYNWAAGDMPVAGQSALAAWVNGGGGLVTSEWVVWLAATGRLQSLAPVFPAEPASSYNSNPTATYAVGQPDPVLNAGLPASFQFPQTNFAGTESNFGARPAARAYYTSTQPSAVAGVVGWSVGGGRVINLSTCAGAASLSDANFGRLFANSMSWVSGGTPVCYANCDGSTSAPILNVNDFICFQSRFAAGNPLANCDGSTSPPVLNVNDFICFQQRFAAGCP